MVSIRTEKPCWECRFQDVRPAKGRNVDKGFSLLIKQAYQPIVAGCGRNVVAECDRQPEFVSRI